MALAKTLWSFCDGRRNFVPVDTLIVTKTVFTHTQMIMEQKTVRFNTNWNTACLEKEAPADITSKFTFSVRHDDEKKEKKL